MADMAEEVVGFSSVSQFDSAAESEYDDFNDVLVLPLEFMALLVYQVN